MTWQILQGDCIEQMRTLEEASVDAVVCDPPYGLEFMGKDWDRLGDRRQPSDETFHKSGVGPFDRATVRYGYATDGAATGRAMQDWHQLWATEALRVLKPGGHLLAFGGTRTVHRLTAGIEDAGFEIRDTILWLYGSGFPKSLDVSKAIDKAAGAGREVVGPPTRHGGGTNGVYAQDDWTRENQATMGAQTVPTTPEAQQWDGWGTALKPSHEPIVVARKPLVGTVAANVLEHGVGALNIDACRIEGQPRATGTKAADASSGSGDVYVGIGSDGAQQQAYDENLPDGRWPANVVLSHTEDCVPVGTKVVKPSNGSGKASAASRGLTGGIFGNGSGEGHSGGHVDGDGTETVEAWDCAPGCPVAELDRQSGRLQSGRLQSGRRAAGVRKGMGYHGADGDGGPAIEGDVGGASRFFYQAKTSRAERNAGLEGFEEKSTPKLEGGEFLPVQANGGPSNTTQADRPAANHHPTVKPINLMRWLVRLFTPPGGLVLDPFTGSGSTGCAAVLEGFDFIGCEREPEYVAIAEARIAFWAQHVGREVEEVLGIVGAGERERRRHTDAGQLGLEVL